MQEIIAFGLTKIERWFSVGDLRCGISHRGTFPSEEMFVDVVKQMTAKQSQSDSEWFLGKD